MDFVAIYLPRRLVEKLKELRADIEDLMIEVLAGKLGLDPSEVAIYRVELAERFFQEAQSYIKQGDAVQASEKLYKAAEECIKALAQYLRTPEYEKALKEGRWWGYLLGKAATRLSNILNERLISYAWAKAYEVHVWGFHEAKYSIEDLGPALEAIEKLVEHTKSVILQPHSGAGNSP